MPEDYSESTGRNFAKITEIGHATMLVEFENVKILTDPWFTDPIMGIVTRPRKCSIKIEDIPELDLILVSHGHFDHCDIKAISRLNKSAAVIVPDKKTATRVRGAGYSDVTILAQWESRVVSGVCVTALPASHPVSELTYVMSKGGKAIYFGGDTRFVKGMREIGEKFDILAAMLPVNGLRLPFAGKVVMDPVDAAEAALQLKARVAIPIHYNISLTVPFLKGIFDKGALGTPQQFAEELSRRNTHVKVVTLNPGESWESE